MTLMTPALILACARAVHPVPGTPVLDGSFALVVPEDWEMVRNHRVMGNAQVMLRSPDGSSAITVELLREDRSTRDLPLSLVADTFYLETGRSLGVSSEPLNLQRLEVSGREAWASTVERRHGPNTRLTSAVFLRGDRHMAVLTLLVGPSTPATVLLAWDTVLSSFELHEPPPQDAPFARDAAEEARLDAVEGPWR